MSALLTRQTRVEIKEYNIAVLSHPELEANKVYAQDPAWEGAGKAVGVKMWRVEQCELIDRPDRSPHVYRAHEGYGYFYNEDAYVVLYTYKKTDSRREPFSYDIHYWIGHKATRGDIVTAASKSVELDELNLGKWAVQYCEAQGHESERFLALFPTFTVFRGSKCTQWHHPAPCLARGVRRIYRMWTTTHKIHKEFCELNENEKQTISYEVSFDDLEIEQGGVYVYDSSNKIALFCSKAGLAWERFWVGEMMMHIGYTRTGFQKNFAHYNEDTRGDQDFMALIGVEKVTPLHSRVYDHTVGPPAKLYRLSQTVPQLGYSVVSSPFVLEALDSKDVYILDDYGNARDSAV